MDVRDQRDRGGGHRRHPSVFISYARPESEFANYLAERLTGAQIGVLWDKELPAGSSFSDVLKASIDNADVVIVLVSPEYFSSQWAQVELAIALSSDKRIIPILVRGNVEGPLRHIQHADARENPTSAVDLTIRAVEAVT
jgi:hypothetical protein